MPIRKHSFLFVLPQQSKSELIQNFDALVDRYAADGAQLLKVVADPGRFLARKIHLRIWGEFTEL